MKHSITTTTNKNHLHKSSRLVKIKNANAYLSA